MKQFNHQKIQTLIESCNVAQGESLMSGKMLNDILEMCQDCRCQACLELLPHFHAALIHFKMQDLRGAGCHLSIACSKINFLYGLMTAEDMLHRRN